jgi:ABC-type antimicrobial peptide transport system permease subunit
VTSLYGVLALPLASLGLYGVTTYTVSRRTREIGVRLALGIPLALLMGRAMQAQLYGVSGHHPGVLATAVVTLVLTAALAAALPARRAASIDPSRALRTH